MKQLRGGEMARRKSLWTEAEEDILLAMFAAGEAVKDVAKALDRSQEAVSSRRLRLRAQAEYGGQVAVKEKPDAG